MQDAQPACRREALQRRTPIIKTSSRTKKRQRGHILRKTSSEKRSALSVKVFFIRLVVSKKDLKHSMPKACDLQRKQDDDRDGREQLNDRELLWRS